MGRFKINNLCINCYWSEKCMDTDNKKRKCPDYTPIEMAGIDDRDIDFYEKVLYENTKEYNKQLKELEQKFIF
jgi:hypothetical protein